MDLRRLVTNIIATGELKGNKGMFVKEALRCCACVKKVGLSEIRNPACKLSHAALAIFLYRSLAAFVSSLYFSANLFSCSFVGFKFPVKNNSLTINPDV